MQLSSMPVLQGTEFHLEEESFSDGKFGVFSEN